MRKLLTKLSILIVPIALLSGQHVEMPLKENMIRASVVEVIFSVLILLILLINNQSTYGLMKAQLEKDNNSGKK